MRNTCLCKFAALISQRLKAPEKAGRTITSTGFTVYKVKNTVSNEANANVAS